jgi:uncharacterized protein GlcG (DUF336 family)
LSSLNLATAQAILQAALTYAEGHDLQPVAVTVVDARGALISAAAQDGTSLRRHGVAFAKAYGALSLGMGSRSIARRAREQAYFIAAVSHVADGHLIPAPGGVLIRDGSDVIGAVGISGDTSDNDEAAALHALESAGLVGDPGSD